jgi:elongation factor P
MLSLSEIKIGKVILANNEPFIVVKAEHHKMGSNALERTFQGNDKAEEADIERKKANYLYKDDQDANLMDNVSFEQFTIPLDQIGDKQKFLKDGIDVDVLYFNGQPVAVDLPIKMTFKVISAPPGVKGNSAGNVNKQIELETGAVINAPMFINEGDFIKVNTETEEYVERA